MSIHGRDPRRRFTSRQRAALYLAAEGVCPNCGADLDLDFHGDHRLAWSRGGATDVTNGDALCPGCNLSKGASSASTLEAHPAVRPARAAGAAPQPSRRRSMTSAPHPGVPVTGVADKCHKEIQ
jgi:5-methylcytosine-specific restriction endonuclease McrA